MKIKVKELAKLIQAEVIGDDHLVLHAPNRIEYAQEGEVTFLRDAKYQSAMSESKASAIITTSALVNRSLDVTWLVVEDPYLAFAWVLEAFYPKKEVKFRQHQFTIEPSAQIAENVQIGAGAYVGQDSSVGSNTIVYPQVYIGNRVKIGTHVILYPGAKILDDTIIGNNCIVHAGAVIGADGFGFVVDPAGMYQKIPQMGNVIIEDEVEIGANTCIDRATLGSTIVKQGVKLDNLIQVGHNSQIGEHTVIAAQTGIAGSCQIGPQNMIGGQVGFAPYVITEKGVKINAQSGVSKSILKEKASMTGTPALPYMTFNRRQVLINKLEGEIKNIKEELKAIKGE
ncbi:MAG TPA: UDP-3-O-(3-hydroxymyristoyl)glucosamine N-acyltransferase [Chitinophagales bacterium]|nr:UDP-3-O-(3-hydroxymyristoyl)glucosamine N-acyltransferase [Chitinophagales bacterium]